MAYNPEDMALDPELVELAAGNKKKEEAGGAEEVKAEAPKEEPKVVCFVSRKEFPLSETVELKYRDQNVRVSKKFVRFPL